MSHSEDIKIEINVFPPVKIEYLTARNGMGHDKTFTRLLNWNDLQRQTCFDLSMVATPWLTPNSACSDKSGPGLILEGKLKAEDINNGLREVAKLMVFCGCNSTSRFE